MSMLGGFGSVVDLASNIYNFGLEREAADRGVAQRYENQIREDNAIWRRVRDLKQAGLSPVLAAGQPAQSSPTITTGSYSPRDVAKSAQEVSETINKGAYNDVIKAQKKLLDEQAKTEATKQEQNKSGSVLNYSGATKNLTESKKSELEILIKNTDWLKTQEFGSMSNPSPIFKIIIDTFGVTRAKEIHAAQKIMLNNSGGPEPTEKAKKILEGSNHLPPRG